MSKAKVAQKAPFKFDVEAGKKYFWCSCGESQNQPFCDGSHKGTEFSPMVVSYEEDQTLFLCGCKATGKAPLCDGTHKNLD